MVLNSIRWRLQLWHGLLLILVLAGFGVTAYQLQRTTLFRRLDEELQQRISVVTGLLRRPPEEPGRPPLDHFRPPNRRPGSFHQSEDEGRPPDPSRKFEDSSAPRELRTSNDPAPPETPDIPSPPPSGRPPMPREQPPFEHRFFAGARDLRLTPQALRLFEATGSNSYYYVIWTRTGEILSRSDTAPDHIPWPGMRNRNPRAPDPSQIRSRENLREMFHYSPLGECVLAGVNTSFEAGEIHRFAGVLLIAGSLVLVLGLAGGWWLASRAIRPIRTISATAAKIAGGDLSQRIPVQNSENELDQLAGVLNSTFARLEAAFAQQAQFTSDAAHELRTPVSVMLSQTQSVLTRERSTAEYCETLQACQRAAQRMRRLIESLLELARLDAGQEQVKKEPIPLDRLLTECVELLRPLAAERKLTIQCTLSSGMCSGDPDRLKQVFTNLLSNAIQYNKDAGMIRVASEKKEHAVVVRIEDTGTGIGPEDLPHIFERFWRADQSRSHSNGHAGLGLAIVKSIVDLHRGTIEVSSELEKGSTFIVSLPT